MPRPHSPYGVTKLAAEHLCALYGANWGVHTVSLRYFSVYGPRQRPDMALHRLVEAALGGEPFPLYGAGEQVLFDAADEIDGRARMARPSKARQMDALRIRFSLLCWWTGPPRSG